MDLSPDIVARYAPIIVPTILVVLTGAISVVAYFLTRYVNQRDDYEKKAEERFGELNKKTQDWFNEHSEKIRVEANRMSEKAESVRSDALTIRKSQLDFQEKAHAEFLQLRRAALELTKALKDIMKGSQEISTRLSVAVKRLEACQERDLVHDEAIRAILNAMRSLKKEIDAMPEQMKSLVQEIAPDIFRVQQRKGPGKD